MISLQNYYRVLLILTSILIIFGLLTLISASSIIGTEQHQDVLYFVKKQLIQGLLLGIIIALFVSRINYQWWKKLALWLFIINIILLILCFIPGFEQVINGSHRWLKLGPITFQPSELLKISVILFLATIFDKYRNEPLRKVFSKTFVIYLITIAVIGIILGKQPSTGTFFIILVTTSIMYFYSKINVKQIIILCLLIAIFITFLVIKYEYRLKRVLIFTNPQKDPQGAGYQILQSLIGIGTGGLLGKGYGNSIQKFNYLPESHTDAIFTIIAEEWGFVGTFALLIVYLLFITTGLKLVKYTKEYYGQLIILGLISGIGIQAFTNIAALCNLMPLTGIPLPFISYGSSAYVTNLMSIGIISNIIRNS